MKDLKHVWKNGWWMGMFTILIIWILSEIGGQNSKWQITMGFLILILVGWILNEYTKIHNLNYQQFHIGMVLFKRDYQIIDRAVIDNPLGSRQAAQIVKMSGFLARYGYDPKEMMKKIVSNIYQIRVLGRLR